MTREESSAARPSPAAGSNYWAKKLRLNKDGVEALKRNLEEIKRGGEEVTDDVLEEAARAIAGIEKYVKPKP